MAIERFVEKSEVPTDFILVTPGYVKPTHSKSVLVLLKSPSFDRHYSEAGENKEYFFQTTAKMRGGEFRPNRPGTVVYWKEL